MESVSAYMGRNPMNYIITIASLLLLNGSFQTLPAVRSERLEGIVVSYDAEMSRTSQADFVVKLETSDGKKYIRLRYSPDVFRPHMFVFDNSEKIRIRPAPWRPFGAPPAKPEQLAPKEMFSDGSVVWIFQAHSPRNPEERGACYGQRKRWLPKDGQAVE